MVMADRYPETPGAKGPDGTSQDAAEAMKVTAQHLLDLGVIDRIVKEPVGGAHRDPVGTCAALADAIAEELNALVAVPSADLRRMREERFLKIGA